MKVQAVVQLHPHQQVVLQQLHQPLHQQVPLLQVPLRVLPQPHLPLLHLQVVQNPIQHRQVLLPHLVPLAQVHPLVLVPLHQNLRQVALLVHLAPQKKVHRVQLVVHPQKPHLAVPRPLQVLLLRKHPQAVRPPNHLPVLHIRVLRRLLPPLVHL
jgi:hypothetical protein